ncbi:MAG: helix-turn-helix domain-containing protein [Acidobacteriota bacterium]
MIWTVLLSVGVVQGLFLATSLSLLSTRNRTATRRLALLVMVFTAVISEELIDRAGLYDELPHAICLAIGGELVIGPLLLLFARAVGRRRTSLGSQALHFAPFALLTLLGLPFYLSSAAAKLAFLAAPTPDWMLPLVIFKAAFLLFYIAWGYRTLVLADGARWLRRGYVVFGCTAGLIYAVLFLHLAGFPHGPDPDSLSSLILAAFLYAAAALVIFRRDLLDAGEPRSVLPRGRRRFLAAELERHLRDEGLARDPELNLGRLATTLGTSQHHLSEVFNQELGKTFYQYLNELRLETIAASLADSSQRQRKVLDLAFDAGFQSKATFYRLFRQRYAVSPSEYRRRHSAGSGSQSPERDDTTPHDHQHS